MTPDYGARGTIGVLTPQANTTVEPEMWSLLPPGWSMLNARLTSSLDTIEARLVDYTRNFSKTAEQFANAPLNAIAIACTGASYLIGKDEEKRIIDDMEARCSVPCITAAQATIAALNELGANRLALLTPYPDSLNQVSTSYWESQGFTVVEKAGPALDNSAFHPIYAMTTDAVYRSYSTLSQSNADAVLMLGTGMPTLAPILLGSQGQLMPAISCNLALTWATVKAATDDDSIDALSGWLDGSHWRERFQMIAGRT